MAEVPSAEFFALQEAVAGRYSLERELGRGGMGIVYLAHDVALDRPVAIKLLPPELATSSDLRTRFLREARTAAQLSHPHIVPIHAVEEHAALVFFVMAYVDGETLGERVRRGGPLSSTDAMRLMQEVAWALAHAHARGLIHRDVKPDNILIDRESGRAMVTDFGIARAVESHTPAGGVVMGTPQYMSPEQARGEELDARTDLYSLGATFFFAITGRLPIDAPAAAALLVRQAAGGAPSITSVRAVVAAPVAQAVDRCLEADRDRRMSSATELAESLRGALAARPEAPQAIRRFLADVDAAGSEAGTAATAALASIAVLAFSFGLDDIFAGIVFYTISGVTGALAAVRLARLTSDARALLRSGYTLEGVRRGILLEEQRDDSGASTDTQPSRLKSAAWLVGGAAVSAAAISLAHIDVSLGVSLVGAAAAVIAPTIAIRRAVRDWLGGRGGLRALMNGRVGRWIFGAAGIGVRDVPPARAVGGEPTIVAIARAADEVYASIPHEHRKQLGDVAAVIHRLEAEALALRGGDAASAARGATAVAALESLRLDLLRLKAGAAPRGELTRDLDRAAHIGDVIDARLADDDSTPLPNV